MSQPDTTPQHGREPKGLGPLPPHELAEPPEVLQRNWGWLLALGIALILGGLAALLLPVLASIAVTGLIGAVFLIAGVLQAVHGWQVQGWRAQLWSAVSAAVYLGGGALIFLNPLAGVVALTVLVVAVFLVDGIVRIVMGIRMRPERGWGWVLAGGVASALFGGVALAVLPQISLTLLGILAAVSLTLEGWACVFLALAARRAGQEDG